MDSNLTEKSSRVKQNGNRGSLGAAGFRSLASEDFVAHNNRQRLRQERNRHHQEPDLLSPFVMPSILMEHPAPRLVPSHGVSLYRNTGAVSTGNFRKRPPGAHARFFCDQDLESWSGRPVGPAVLVGLSRYVRRYEPDAFVWARSVGLLCERSPPQKVPVLFKQALSLLLLCLKACRKEAVWDRKATV